MTNYDSKIKAKTLWKRQFWGMVQIFRMTSCRHTLNPELKNEKNFQTIDVTFFEWNEFEKHIFVWVADDDSEKEDDNIPSVIIPYVLTLTMVKNEFFVSEV